MVAWIFDDFALNKMMNVDFNKFIKEFIISKIDFFQWKLQENDKLQNEPL